MPLIQFENIHLSVSDEGVKKVRKHKKSSILIFLKLGLGPSIAHQKISCLAKMQLLSLNNIPTDNFYIQLFIIDFII